MSMLVASLLAARPASFTESGGTYVASTYVVIAVSSVLLISAALLLTRAVKGPTVFDRILAINSLGTKTVVLVTCFAFFDLEHGNPNFFIDTALVYALINFIATIAILKYVQHRRLN
jgi:multicomponent Na+:H+ antiporter subunit F